MPADEHNETNDFWDTVYNAFIVVVLLIILATSIATMAQALNFTSQFNEMNIQGMLNRAYLLNYNSRENIFKDIDEDSSEQLDREEVLTYIQNFDEDGDGKISNNEFRIGLSSGKELGQIPTKPPRGRRLSSRPQRIRDGSH